jgi:outer membrane protein assembly factor BamB
VRQVLAAAGDMVFGVMPADGRVLWSAPGPGGEVANSPIVLPGDRVLLSRWEESQLIEVTRRDATFITREVWRSPRMRSSNGPTVYRDGFLYGFGGAQLICMNAETTDVVWREKTGAGTLIAAGGHLIVLSADSGDLQIAPISASGFKASHRARVLEPGVTAVTGPSFANGRIYVRNLKEIVALRLK